MKAIDHTIPKLKGFQSNVLLEKCHYNVDYSGLHLVRYVFSTGAFPLAWFHYMILGLGPFPFFYVNLHQQTYMSMQTCEQLMALLHVVCRWSNNKNRIRKIRNNLVEQQQRKRNSHNTTSKQHNIFERIWTKDKGGCLPHYYIQQ